MRALFSVFLDATFYGSVMILLALLLRPILRKAPRRILCVLWLFVMVRLLLPIQIESKLSLQPQIVPSQTVAELAPETPVVPPVQAPVTPLPEMPSAPDVLPSPQPALTLADILLWVWFGGMCATFIYMIASYSLLKHQLLDSVPCEKGVWEADRIPGAFMLGYLWPQIYLPTGLDPDDRQLIIAHEKAHIRRGDAWWKLLGMLCLCIHWYNPLVWLGYWLMSRDIETACDEQVIRTMPLDRRKAYSYALLSAGKRMSGIFVSPVAFSEVNLKQRIKKVLSYRNPGVWITATGIVICVLVAVFFMTDPAPEQRSNPAQDTIQTNGSTESTAETGHTHNWQPATCSAPKICTVCGAAEGAKLEHNYVKRQCTVCGMLLPTEELRFMLNADSRSYTCDHYLGTDPYVVIPATYNGLPVTVIGRLGGTTTITHITLPDSITTVSNQAFQSLRNMESISLPDSVTAIGESAFSDCWQMTGITLSQNLTAIGPYAFARCLNLTQIHIPASVTSIGEGAFQNCYQLQSITYGGTMAQWNAIQKDKDWIGTAPLYGWNIGNDIPAAGVTCSDGFVPF